MKIKIDPHPKNVKCQGPERNNPPTTRLELFNIFIKEQWRVGTAVALNYMLFVISNSGLTRFYYVSDVGP